MRVYDDSLGVLASPTPPIGLSSPGRVGGTQLRHDPTPAVRFGAGAALTPAGTAPFGSGAAPAAPGSGSVAGTALSGPAAARTGRGVPW